MLITYLSMHTSACKGEHVMMCFYIVRFIMHSLVEYWMCLKPSVLPGNDTLVPYVLVVDDAFPLTSYLIKPYAGEVPTESPESVFNCRLSRARRIVENAFGLLASVFRIFRKATHRQTVYSWRHYTGMYIFTQFLRKKLRRKKIA